MNLASSSPPSAAGSAATAALDVGRGARVVDVAGDQSLSATGA